MDQDPDGNKKLELNNHFQTYFSLSGEIPVVQLNLSSISLDLGVERDVVDTCLREILAAFSRTAHSKKRAILPFKDIGSLFVSEGKAKFKFCRDLMRVLDGGKGMLMRRPNTSDSFVSRSSILSSTPSTMGLPSAKLRNVWSAAEERPLSVISNHGASALDLRPLEPLQEVGSDYTREKRLI